MRLGEFLRRLSLAATAALMVARAFWASEDAAAGTGRAWLVAIFSAAAVACASAVVAGRLRFRLSGTDLAFLTLVVVVAWSANHAADRRPALNLGWEWVGLGTVYLLVRNLPRTPGESGALAACLAATAAALSAYGLYQVSVEFPELQEQYRRNPEPMLERAGMDPSLPPDSPERRHFEDRLLGSNEPFATFALANSLAGYLVGPTVLLLAVALDRLSRRADGFRPMVGIALAVPPLLLLIACLILTKSRSAYLGALLGWLVVAWQARGRIPRRGRLVAAGLLVAALAVLGTLAARSGGLDLKVLTESTKSLRYRWEYWRGAIGVLSDGGTWLAGLGPANFANAYLRHKLPESSEEISDPHNLLLEVWTTGGILAAAALVATVVFGVRDLLSRPSEPRVDGAGSEAAAARIPPPADPAPPRSAAWVVACGGLGCLAAIPLGGLNPFAETGRWVVLAVSWVAAALMLGPLWRGGGRPLPAGALGAWVIAVVVNLLAAGGIGFPSVAIAVWVPLAVGLNLRDDRRCGRLEARGGTAAAFALACLLAAVIGLFTGAVLKPVGSAEALALKARAALLKPTPDVRLAREALHEAAEADRYDPRPWLELARFELRMADRERQAPDSVQAAHIANHLTSALEPPRNPRSYATHVQREQLLAALLARMAGAIVTPNILALKQQRLDSLREAAQLYPTNPRVRARLADLLAELGRFDEAIAQADEALRLDARIPHPEKRLQDRAGLEARRARWSSAAAAASAATP